MSGSICGCGRCRLNESATPPITNAMGYGTRSRFATIVSTTMAARKVTRTEASEIGGVLDRYAQRAQVECVAGDHEVEAARALGEALRHPAHGVAE